MSRRSLSGKRTLELGSGMGLAGMAAAMLGAHVVLTDVGDVLPLLARNVQSNFDGQRCCALAFSRNLALLARRWWWPPPFRGPPCCVPTLNFAWAITAMPPVALERPARKEGARCIACMVRTQLGLAEFRKRGEEGCGAGTVAPNCFCTQRGRPLL